MPSSEPVNWQPMSQMPLVAGLIDGATMRREPESPAPMRRAILTTFIVASCTRMRMIECRPYRRHTRGTDITCYQSYRNETTTTVSSRRAQGRAWFASVIRHVAANTLGD
jgi:hypothetical protein